MKRLLLAASFLCPLGAQAATLTLPPVIVGGSGSGGTCPVDDGSSGATAGTPNLPTALASYSSANTIRRLGCKAAGVDYHVGVATNATLKVPTSSNLPSGCSLSGSTVSCSTAGVVFSGYDMTGKQLSISGANVTISGNKWSLTSNCLAPIFYNPSGTWHIEGNSMDGKGLTTCVNGLAGGLSAMVYNVGAPAGTIVYVRWNEFILTPEDTLNFGGSSGATSGGVQPIIAWNLWNGQGNTGHPDGIQLTGGTFRNIKVLGNSYINTRVNNDPGIQPLHLEAQLSSNIYGSETAFNSVAMPGTCNGGNNWPNSPNDPPPYHCVGNFAIACKNDPGYSPPDSFTGYNVHDNFVDPTGLIAAISISSDCTNVTSAHNVDMTTGKDIINAN